MAVVEIKLDKLKIHPKNVRKEYEGIEELAQSIKQNGIMQNLTVVPDPEEAEMFLVVIGNRRLTAARQAGIASAPCVIIESMEEKDQVTTMLTENMNRKDLKVYEEASAMQMCVSDFGLGVEEMEKATGLSKTTINHRLNVAKLNEKVLRQKMNDDEFQMSLSDLYSLEKVEDVKKRNQILKEARNSADLANRARAAAREEMQNKNQKVIVELCKKKGIKAAPKAAENEFYSNKWERLEQCDLNGKPPKQLKNVNGKGDLFWIVRCGYFYIIRKKAKEKQEPTKEELIRKERDKRKREVDAKYKTLFEDMGDFIRSIFDGRIPSVKDTELVKEMCWDLIMLESYYISPNDIICAILGKELYAKDLEQAEREAAEEKAKSLSMEKQMLAVAYWNLHNVMLMCWNGTYQEFKGEKVLKLFDILNLYGYEFLDDDLEAVVRGTSDLYDKKED